MSVEAPKTSKQTGLASRKLACHWLYQVLGKKLFLDDILAEAEKEDAFLDLSARDKAFARSITMTALRRKGQIDGVLAHFLSKTPPPKSGINEILLASSAQLLFMDTPPHAAIDMAVRLAKKKASTRSFSGLVNAVLRKVANEGPGLIETQNKCDNLPDWLVRRWEKNYGGERAVEICLAQLQKACVDITVKENPQDWAEKLGGDQLIGNSIRLRPNTSKQQPITQLAGFDEGAWWVQDVAASLPATLLRDLRGKMVADLCAAPGGKTMQLAAAGRESECG